MSNYEKYGKKYRETARLKRLKQGLVIPNLQKDLKEIRAGRNSHKSGKDEKIQVYVQVRGL